MAGRVTLRAKAQRLQQQLHSGNSSGDGGLERQGPHGAGKAGSTWGNGQI